MRKLCLGLSVAAIVMFAACGDDNGSSADDLGESSSSGEVDVIESCASAEYPSSNSGVVDSNTYEDSSSSESGESNSSDSKESSSSSEEIGEESSSSEGISESSSSSEKVGEESSSSESGESSSSDSEESSSSSEEVEVDRCKNKTFDSENEICDSHDGHVYKIVKIGTGQEAQTWMAENLNYETQSNSWCFGATESDPKTENCDAFGRLYTWASAIDSVGLYKNQGLECGHGKECEGSLPDKVQGICPDGWHLPSQSEWNTLFTNVGGQSDAGHALKSTSGWLYNGHGADVYGFSALPAGGVPDGYIAEIGTSTYFWSSDENYTDYAYVMFMDAAYSDAGLNFFYKYSALSVRCLKD